MSASDPTCPTCTSRGMEYDVVTDYKEGRVICTGCGLVLENQYLDERPERRFDDDLEDPTHHGDPISALYAGIGLHTVSGGFSRKRGRGASERAVEGGEAIAAQMTRTPAERRLLDGYRQIEAVAGRLRVGTPALVEDAKYVLRRYYDANSSDLPRAQTALAALVASCLCLAAEDGPTGAASAVGISVDDLARAADVDRCRVTRMKTVLRKSIDGFGRMDDARPSESLAVLAAVAAPSSVSASEPVASLDAAAPSSVASEPAATTSGTGGGASGRGAAAAPVPVPVPLSTLAHEAPPPSRTTTTTPDRNNPDDNNDDVSPPRVAPFVLTTFTVLLERDAATTIPREHQAGIRRLADDMARFVDRQNLCISRPTPASAAATLFLALQQDGRYAIPWPVLAKACVCSVKACHAAYAQILPYADVMAGQSGTPEFRARFADRMVRRRADVERQRAKRRNVVGGGGRVVTTAAAAKVSAAKQRVVSSSAAAVKRQ